ncbi:hypothetical protein A3Q56_03347 [Intoshia linei]|uniref:Lysosomal Pro-X carboxypeptidase n=1 Tax=Intoshia linei TaxID=1819745 RepID=A0A177B3I2_9BILA|nr:hypothetical protein A3Q56_03347 [Intoshia linei]
MLSKLYLIQFFCIVLLQSKLISNDPVWSSSFYTSKLDHNNQTSDTLNIKILYTLQYVKRTSNCILFYTGNEAKIEWFWNNTQQIFVWAEKLHCVVVYMEHRFYGDSIPENPKRNYQYLQIYQAMKDYVNFLTEIKNDGIENVIIKSTAKIIAIGGSYGGMLAAFLRVYHYYIIDAAIAASAPVSLINGKTIDHEFYAIASKSFVHFGKQSCADNIKSSWKFIDEFYKSTDGPQQIKKRFNLCNVMNLTDFTAALQDMYVMIAMLNYDSPMTYTWKGYRKFQSNHYERPVERTCMYMNTNMTSSIDSKNNQTINNVAATFMDYFPTNDDGCIDLVDKTTVNYDSWDYQACTELAEPMATPEENVTIFPDIKFSWNKTISDCFHKYNVMYDRDVVYEKDGSLDPWSAGAIEKYETATHLISKYAAHHNDLRITNNKDTKRVQAIELKWLAEIINN